MTLDIAWVRESLAQLAARETGQSLAQRAHGFRLRPPVDPATLKRAEQAIGAPLPEGYRHFLTAVGDGGAGPYWGVVPLGEALERWTGALGDLTALGRDCPLTSDVDFGELIGQPDDWDEHLARLESDPEYEAEYDRLAVTYAEPPWIDGRVPLVDYGCGDWFFLVVRGPRRGTVWVDSVDGSTGLYCLEVDFETFYARWLRRALAGEELPNAYYSYLEYGDNPRYRPV
ncbi:SMI1/KNR4 family protein [Phytohabitans kaempferiae]|uniref:SMI1/KNR4 family protein n=1 Tax=Phytohabitans kaempferiae TaxID=1620943 RepID=A0ABV6MG94_9ACTN